MPTASHIIDDIIRSPSEHAAYSIHDSVVTAFTDDYPRRRRDDFFRIPLLHPSSHHPDERQLRSLDSLTLDTE